MRTSPEVLSSSNTIVVPLDGSPQSELALPFAVDLARRTGGTLHLIRVHVPMTIIPAPDSIGITIDPAVEAEIEKSARWIIETRATALRDTAQIPVTAELLVGRPQVLLGEEGQDERRVGRRARTRRRSRDAVGYEEPECKGGAGDEGEAQCEDDREQRRRPTAEGSR